MDFEKTLSGKKVLVTGHTGFTGSWACIWLSSIDVQLFGYSLAPETTPNLFTEANLQELIPGEIADIRDFKNLLNVMSKFKPDLVLHLAAQPLVREGYRKPRETFEINCQGTANVLEAARLTSSVKGVLCITTDKVYKNLESEHRYIESDELEGKDPYSASKVAAEMVIQSYQKSFRSVADSAQHIAVARGGNIIGGGDWSEDRLIPDFVRAFQDSKSLVIRSPYSTRPWQHVLSLVEGYMRILAGLISEGPFKFSQAFNLGPVEEETYSVLDVLKKLQNYMGQVDIEVEQSELMEAGKLAIRSDLAREILKWEPKWTTEQSIKETAQWYKNYLIEKTNARLLCEEQINSWKSTLKDV
jgi:CDP-glucose 4,6-dehydratase